MKNIFAIIAIVFAIFTYQLSLAQTTKDIKTSTIKVEGVCNACKKRIENAAYIPGVKEAIWNKETSLLTVVYKTSKTSVEKIEAAVAKSGHDAGAAKAAEATYNKLPACCNYKSEHIHKH